MTNCLLSFGHGYSARALAHRLLPQGWKIIGTTRDPLKAEILAKEGAEAVLWPDGDLRAALSKATHILISTAPNDSGDPVLNLLANEIRQAAPHIKWAGYLSTTAVYGDHQGGWVDETTPPTPATRRGHWRLAAENHWQELATSCGLPLHIFRLAGIYGPGRGPLAKVQNGTARRIIKPDQLFSRIHVADIARILQASLQKPAPGTIYNLCDDTPAPPQDVIAYAAELLGLPVPPAEDFETAEMSPMARSFYAESKQVRNHRIKAELGIELLYPTYQSGLQALLDSDPG